MNRKLKFSALALLAVLVLWACGGASGPQTVGEEFLNAMAKGDIETAKKFATKDSQNALDMMAGSALTKAANPDKIEIGEVKEEGDKATLSYKENGMEKSIGLQKEEGQWKVAFSKSGGSTDNSLDNINDDLGKAMDEALNEASEDMKDALEEVKQEDGAH